MTDEIEVKDKAAWDAAEKVADYEHGWSSDIETDFAPKGLTEDTVRFISAKKNEPEWMLEWRLKAYRHWLTMEMPDWAKLNIEPIDYQDAYYYAAPKAKPKLNSLDEVDPEILRVYEKLGIPIAEQEVLAGVEGARKVAVDAVFDSVSVATTFRAELERAGVIFRSISEAIKEYPDLVRKWLGKIVPMHDNYFATLNCAVFSDGTFVYIPEGVRCPMELSTYFRINAENTGQFERTLIVAMSVTSKAAPRRCATRTSFMPPWSNSLHWTMPRSNIRPCRTGIPAMPRAKAASIISSPSALCVRDGTAR
jgi:Fe-S cluster assembly protein SufB